jgi:hypothetical protein
MGVTIRKFRLVNPTRTAAKKRRRSSTARKAQSRKRNPVHLVTLGFTNPQRGTAVTKKRKKNSAQARKRRKNPFSFSKKTAAVKVRRRRRNPEILSMGTGLLKSGASALVGLVAARQLPQLVLGAKNTGILGYIATIVATVATSYAVKKAAGPGPASAAMIGGAMQFASRLLNEYVSPVGKVLSLSGVGDPVAAGLGEIRQSYFPLPVPTQPGTLTPIIPGALQPPKALPPAAASAAASTAMSGVRRSGSRFASRY